MGTRARGKSRWILKIPITIAGMSFRIVERPMRKRRWAAAPRRRAPATTTGDGGMTPEERGQSTKHLVYQYLPSRYGMNPDDLRKADAIEIVVGQGAKPGVAAACCWARKISANAWPRCATCLKGIDQRSACRHPDWTGPG